MDDPMTENAMPLVKDLPERQTSAMSCRRFSSTANQMSAHATHALAFLLAGLVLGLRRTFANMCRPFFAMKVRKSASPSRETSAMLCSSRWHSTSCFSLHAIRSFFIIFSTLSWVTSCKAGQSFDVRIRPLQVGSAPALLEDLYANRKVKRFQEAS